MTTTHQGWRGLIDHYRARLPVGPDDRVVSLSEGNTPLVRADRLAAVIAPGVEVYLKCEGQNPTGSFKDRGMTVAVTRAVAEGVEAIICASTGNTSASAAAFAARGGVRAYVVVPQGKIALGKLSQAVMHGARVIQIEGNFDHALTLVRDIKERYPTQLALVNSVNPDRIQGQKTAAFEICDVLGRAPDYHLLPVGNAGNITAYWRGYCEYHTDGITTSRPVMMGFEAAGAAPLVHGHVVAEPRTIATAIRIGNPASWDGAIGARDESGGAIEAVEDEDILAAYRLLARTEGVFAEPASAISVAGALRMGARGQLRPGDVLVLTLTGHGLKDPDTAIANSEPTITIPSDLARLAAVLELG
ncbi:MAG TPA: threonine synthase [Candidatus Binatia bacterium]|jgi:threonine synthase|nr:threonine synthase [Candidatus Binatia bacterium]